MPIKGHSNMVRLKIKYKNIFYPKSFYQNIIYYLFIFHFNIYPHTEIDTRDGK